MIVDRDILGTLSYGKMRANERLGEYFVRNGKASSDDINKALRLKNAQGLVLGGALIRLGIVTEKDIAQALSSISGFPLVSKNDLDLKSDLLRKIPEAVVRKYNALPLQTKNGKLEVAVDRPMAIQVQRALERLVRLPIQQKIALSSHLQTAIALAYTSDTVIDADGASAIDIVSDLIVKAIKFKASDIHLEPMEERVRLRFRMDGVLKEIESYTLSQYASIVARIKVLANLDISEKRLPQDGAIAYAQGGIEIDLRVSSMPSIYGEKIVMRLLAGKNNQLTMDQIGLCDQDLKKFMDLVKRPYGILLIVGPTGSGKSTTLAATLQTINDPSINIVTVEDPVEYKIKGITQVHVSSQTGKITFAAALRSILRQDPDVIMVGETRDSETADISLRAALTGHMVFTTLHTNDAPGALPRLLDMGCEPFLVSSSVSGVLAQRLVRKLCPHCRQPYQPEPDKLGLLNISHYDKDRRWYAPKGCPQCNHTGYLGRIGIFELLVADKDIQRAVMENASGERITEIAIRNGMRSLREDAIDKLESGLISLDEVIRVTLA